MLQEIIEAINLRLQSNNIQGLNVRNTDRVFVSPILDVIGWNMTNLNDVMADYDPKVKQGAMITYALCSNNKPLLLVEVLPLFSDISKKKSYNKVLTTFKNSDAKYLCITNGIEWLVYDKNTIPLLYVDVRSDSADTKFRLLQKTSLQNGLLEEYAQNNPIKENEIFKRKELVARGYKLSEETHKGLNELKKKINAYRGVKDQEISVSILMEYILEEFLNRIDRFNYKDISNEAILKKRIKEVFDNNKDQ